mmetsp:Transcript_7137/g.30397  ORF Transcript_7137/g.30397 Transcript_7137/m.30397 type:complete len:201 (+) Transcript_7137:394-996(+)
MRSSCGYASTSAKRSAFASAFTGPLPSETHSSVLRPTGAPYAASSIATASSYVNSSTLVTAWFTATDPVLYPTEKGTPTDFSSSSFLSFVSSLARPVGTSFATNPPKHELDAATLNSKTLNGARYPGSARLNKTSTVAPASSSTNPLDSRSLICASTSVAVAGSTTLPASRAAATMFPRPLSSLTTARASLPTFSGATWL